MGASIIGLFFLFNPLGDIELKHSAESIKITACLEQHELGSLIKDTEDIEIGDDDLTGGNLGHLEEFLSELIEETRHVKEDDLAVDVRPNKVQADNEMVGVDNNNLP